jgi:HEAT repeat protein
VVLQPERGEPLRKKLDEDRHQRIRDLVKNPLRLSLLCQSWYFHQGDLPKTKAALYEQFTEAFYEWKKEPHYTTLTEREKLNAALGLLAREAIDKEKSRFGIRRDFAFKILGEDLFKLATEKLNWLVEVYKETGKPVYAFFHPTFQEFFAACAIPNWDYFLKHVPHNPTQGTYRSFERQWKEVILLWLGREEVETEQKEAFIRALMEFEDGCGDFYWYRAVFLAAAGIAEFKDCSNADEIVVKLVEWSVETEIWTWRTVFDSVIAEGARATVLETDYAKVIKVLIYLLKNELLDYDARWKAFNILDRIGSGNSEVIAALSKLMDTSLDDKELPQEAAFFLGKIDPDKQEALIFLKQQLWNTTLPDWVRLQAASFLGEIDKGNPEAITFLTELIDQNPSLDLNAASTLGEIDPGNQKAIKTLTELLKTERGDCVMNIPLIAACNLLETDPENPDAIRSLRDFIQLSQKSWKHLQTASILPGLEQWERLQAASALGKAQPYKQEAIKVLCELINETIQTGKDQQLLQQALENLKQLDSSILYSLLSWQQETFLSKGINLTLENENSLACILALTKYCLEEESCLGESYYEYIWRCVQDLNYPDFYRAWHSRVYGTRTEKGEDITVIEFT